MLKVKKSAIGLGLFTTSQIEANKTICEIKGKKIHYQALLKIGGKVLDNCFRYSLNYYISPEHNYGNFLNHSCQPNSKIEKRGTRLFLVSTTNINKNSEIVLDYSTILAKDDTWTMKCFCKNKNCRKVIENYSKLNKKLLNYYIKERVLPAYIIKL